MHTWTTFLEKESKAEYYKKLMRFLENEYTLKTIYPPREDLFSCFHACALEDVKVVILGQDPYHQSNQAHGLCFSVRKGVKIPPSLKNIYRELKSDMDIDVPNHGYLMDWAKQGVFMMNAVMSVEEGKAGSHQKKGWEIFTDRAISVLNQQEQGIVFILWGNWAQKKMELITNKQHRIICSPHPSPLSAYQGFFGSKPFSKTNTYLLEMNRTPIDWKIGE
ncbi:uracil-DNA glycosylase [Amedibacillus sp. YH-ame6]